MKSGATVDLGRREGRGSNGMAMNVGPSHAPINKHGMKQQSSYECTQNETAKHASDDAAGESRQQVRQYQAVQSGCCVERDTLCRERHTVSRGTHLENRVYVPPSFNRLVPVHTQQQQHYNLM
jgi:hypothetical protein